MERHATERKDRLHEKFAAALDQLDMERREPDRWEEECLSYALSAMSCSLYLVAEIELDAFFRPVAERSPEAVAALEARPRRFTKAMLRLAHDYVLARDRKLQAIDLEMPPALVAQRLDLQSSLFNRS